MLTTVEQFSVEGCNRPMGKPSKNKPPPAPPIPDEELAARRALDMVRRQQGSASNSTTDLLAGYDNPQVQRRRTDMLSGI
jgi:hypothetical protein